MLRNIFYEISYDRLEYTWLCTCKVVLFWEALHLLLKKDVQNNTFVIHCSLYTAELNFVKVQVKIELKQSRSMLRCFVRSFVAFVDILVAYRPTYSLKMAQVGL